MKMIDTVSVSKKDLEKIIEVFQIHMIDHSDIKLVMDESGKASAKFVCTFSVSEDSAAYDYAQKKLAEPENVAKAIMDFSDSLVTSMINLLK